MTRMIDPRRGALCVALVLLSLASPAHADFRLGDLVASEFDNPIIPVFPTGRIETFRSGMSIGTLAAFPAEIPRGIAFDSVTNLYVATGSTILRFNQAGLSTGQFGDPSQYAVPGQGQGPFSMVFDRIGNVYVSVFGLGDRHLAKLSPIGTVLQVYDVPSAAPTDGPWAIDLSADQCTLYYAVTFSRRIGRLDVCQNLPLPDFTNATPGTNPQALRILPDATILAATGEALVRLNTSGQVIMTYVVSSAHAWSAVAIDVSVTTFWAASDMRLYNFQLPNPTPIAGPINMAEPIVSSLAVVGEPRAALSPGSVPALGPLFLGALIAAFLLVALRRLH